MSQRFPQNSIGAVGSAMFLRFINPAIVSPYEAGILDKKPPARIERGLKLMSKVTYCLVQGATHSTMFLFFIFLLAVLKYLSSSAVCILKCTDLNIMEIKNHFFFLNVGSLLLSDLRRNSLFVSYVFPYL